MINLSTILFDQRINSSFIQLSEYLRIDVFGDDAESFLSNQVTTNILNHKSHTFKESAIVDEKGKLVSSFFICKFDKSKYFLIVKKEFEQVLIERLNKFLISEDVDFNVSTLDIYMALNEFENEKDEYLGTYCLLPAKITFQKPESENLDSSIHSILKFSSGFVDMGIHAKPNELITNTYLALSAIDFNKGCYPGQETISKITNNRGAAYFPVALVGEKEILSNSVLVNDKKVGTVVQKIQINNQVFHYAFLNRENRIEDKKIKINNSVYTIRNFPLIDSTLSVRSEEIFDEAVRLFQVDESERSKELLRYLIKLNPSYADAYESLGVILGRERKFEEAIEVMKMLAEVDKTSVMAQTNLSMYYMQLGDKETAEMHKAEATLKQFEQFGVEAEKRDQKEKVLAQIKADKDKRESMFHQVLEIDPDDALANFGLGELEIERENFLKAKDHLEKAILADAKYSVAYLALAKALLKLNEVESAKETLNKGIEVASKLGDLMPANEMQSILNNL